MRIGGRALGILTALVERPGELVGKDELIARVWPKITVEEINLRVNVAALRKALGDGRAGRRYVANVPGRGYSFVAPVERSDPVRLVQQIASDKATHNLPNAWTQTIGRTDAIDAICRQLPQHRMVTIVGPGGIGKTTVALAVAESLIANYRHGVWLVDLAPLHDAKFVAAALAAVLGLTIHAENVADGIMIHLQDKQMLIVIDSCEHFTEAGASLAEQILGCSTGVHVLVTSREPLRARGERVYRLSPLASPPPGSAGLTAQDALSFPAVQLFVEHAGSITDGFKLTDTDAPVVADICHKLDGMALAIELAATRTDIFGLRDLSALLDDRLRLLKQGRRTRLPRHRTLTAALDWSYEFLPENERAILRCLSVFAGAFTLGAVSAVATSGGVAVSEVIEGLANLVAKSLVSADISGDFPQYRLLDTTRAYALQKLIETGQHAAFLRRHAEYHRELLQLAEAEWEARPTDDWLSDYRRRIDDVRSALEWAFSAGGDRSIGVALTVAALPLWLHLSLMDECRICAERALAGDPLEQRRSQSDDMKLYAALGAALLYARGPIPEADVIWSKSLHGAENLANSEYQLRALWGLSAYRIAVGDYRDGLQFAERFCVLANERGDTAAGLNGGRMIGAALHYIGDQGNARQHLDRVVTHYIAPHQRSHITRFLFDQSSLARGTLSNVLWLQGYPDQAVQMAQAAFDDARAIDHILSLCSVLVHSVCTIALYVGDLATAERFLALLQDHLAKHTLTVWNALARCLRGMLLIERGEIAGLSLLRSSLAELREVRFVTRYPIYLGVLAQALGARGGEVVAEARNLIDEAVAWAEEHEERWCMPELLRIRGELLQRDGSAAAVAEEQYMRALEGAREQQALSWELRAATGLARLWHRHGRSEEAKEVLSSTYSRFTEGFETRDLRLARALLDR